MHTKGIASVRSPVRNLVQSSASATHEAFVRSVIKSFREEYAIDEDVSKVLLEPGQSFIQCCGVNPFIIAVFRSRDLTLYRG